MPVQYSIFHSKLMNLKCVVYQSKVLRQNWFAKKPHNIGWSTNGQQNTIEIVDRTLRDILYNSEPFDGHVFAFGGDSRQVLLVVPRATRQKTINYSLVRSYL